MLFLAEIRDDQYAVVRIPMDNHYGYGMGNPNVILLASEMKGKDLLNTAIHEFKHQFDPDCKEAVVTRFADQLSEILWKMGCRIRESDAEAAED